MIRTYFDAGVLIAAVRQELEFSERALRLMLDPNREFVSSEFLRLEVMPKAVFHRRADQVAIFGAFFARVSIWARPIDAVVAQAEREAALHGLNAMDALHVAAASLLHADEFITTEGPRKPIHRTESVLVVTL